MGNTLISEHYPGSTQIMTKRISVHEPFRKVPIYHVPYSELGPSDNTNEALKLMDYIKKNNIEKMSSYMVIATNKIKDCKVHVKESTPNKTVEVVWKIPHHASFVKNIRIRNTNYLTSLKLELCSKNKIYTVHSETFDIDDGKEKKDSIWIGLPEVPLPLSKMKEKLVIRATYFKNHLDSIFDGTSWIEAEYVYVTNEMYDWLKTDLIVEIPEYQMVVRNSGITSMEIYMADEN